MARVGGGGRENFLKGDICFGCDDSGSRALVRDSLHSVVVFPIPKFLTIETPPPELWAIP
jgi:hypothetical protein